MYISVQYTEKKYNPVMYKDYIVLNKLGEDVNSILKSYGFQIIINNPIELGGMAYWGDVTLYPSKLFGGGVSLGEFYDYIHQDDGVIRHRVDLITNHEYTDRINQIPLSDISQIDIQIHDDFLNDKIRVGDDKEKNARYASMFGAYNWATGQFEGGNENLVIYFLLDFKFFYELYWKIGLMQNQPLVKQFAIDLYKQNAGLVQGQFGIPDIPSEPFWKDPHFLQFVIMVAITAVVAFSAPYISAYFAGAPVATVESAGYSLVGSPLATGGTTMVTTGSTSYIAELQAAGWTKAEASLIAVGETPLTYGGLAIEGMEVATIGGVDVAVTPYMQELAVAGWTPAEALAISQGVTPLTYGGLAIEGVTPVVAGATLTTTATVAGTGGLLTTVGTGLNLASTAKKILYEEKPKTLANIGSFSDFMDVLSDINNQSTQMLLLTLGGFIFFQLLSD